MTSLPEQLSAARNKGLDAQFQLFRSLATQALDNAGRLVNLNLSASRESVERSSRAMRQLIGATDPRDLTALRTHAEEQVRSLFSYSRDLFNIAASAQPQVLRTISAATPTLLAAPVPAPAEVQAFVDAVGDSAAHTAQAAAEQIDTAVEKTVEAASEAVQTSAPEAVTEAVTEVEPQADSVAVAPADDPVVALVQERALKDEPVVVQSAEAQDTETTDDNDGIAARTKPIARAAGKGAPKAAAAQQPLAAPVSGKASVTSIGATPPKRRK